MTHSRYLFYFSMLIFIATDCFPALAQQDLKLKNQQKKVIFIAGRDSHPKGQHEYNGGVTFLASKLKEALPDIDTAVYHNGWPQNPGALKNASTIILFSDGAEGHIILPHLNEIEKLMNNGTGLVMLHFTLEVPKGNEAENVRDLVGGYFETNWSVNPFWIPEIKTFPHHPIANGVKPFAVLDEWYYHLRFVPGMKNITPILKTLPPDSTLNRPEGTHTNNPFVREAIFQNKEPQTLAWAYDRPAGGRAFGFTGGHTHANWKNDSFRMLVLNAIVWTAKMEVPKEGIRTKTPTSEELDKLTKPAGQ